MASVGSCSHDCEVVCAGTRSLEHFYGMSISLQKYTHCGCICFIVDCSVMTIVGVIMTFRIN